MNDLEKGIATLIRSAITAEVLPLPGTFDIEQAYEQITRHQVRALAYQGAVRCGISKQLPAMQRLFRSYCDEILFGEEQLQAVDQLCSTFEKAGIDYMPLKGCNLKKLYPRQELRKMGDADILIREERYPEVEAILRQQGYTQVEGADHTLNWRKKNVLIEIHIRMMPTIVEHYPYFGTGWKRAVHQTGHLYAFHPEDEYIFVFVHFVKHYRYSGIGCRQLVDLWVYRRAYPDLDQAYIEAELQKLNLLKFHENLLRTAIAWFEDGEEDDVTRLITETIFASGSWGSSQTAAVSQGAELRAKNGANKNPALQTALFYVFLPYENMVKRYKKLEKFPFLLPFFWVIRGFEVLLTRRQNLGKAIKTINNASTERVTAYEDALRKVGLEYRFEDMMEEVE